jgi:hypothetical protein
MSVAENVEMLPQPRGGDYEIARFNALRHGVLSKYCVLPWEDSAEYDTLLEALVAEHNPQGPTEEHLVEELAGVIWRKRRLRLGDRASAVAYGATGFRNILFRRGEVSRRDLRRHDGRVQSFPRIDPSNAG